VEKSIRPFFLIFFLFTSCGGEVPSIDYGKTTLKHLIQQKGEPLKSAEVPVSKGRIHHYPNDLKFQTTGETIIVGFRKPLDTEKTLIYWKHLFRDCPTKIKKISAQERELSCEQRGLSVVYSLGSEYVARVIEYEKK
jgi:hypothetical protein